MVSVNTEANEKFVLKQFYRKRKVSYKYKTQII